MYSMLWCVCAIVVCCLCIEVRLSVKMCADKVALLVCLVDVCSACNCVYIVDFM